jgi:hypothetical protein
VVLAIDVGEALRTVFSRQNLVGHRLGVSQGDCTVSVSILGWWKNGRKVFSSPIQLIASCSRRMHLDLSFQPVAELKDRAC